MMSADYIQNLVDEVKAWQSNKGTQKIPNKHSKDTTEAKLGKRFVKLLLRRSKALGTKPSGRQLEPTEVALVNSVPGVPGRGCSVGGELVLDDPPPSRHPCPGCRRNRRADHPEHTRIDGCRYPDGEPVVWRCPGCTRNRPADHDDHTRIDGECRVGMQRARTSGSRGPSVPCLLYTSPSPRDS